MDSTSDPEDIAIKQLEQFGLSSYAARTFVALASLGSGSARDISEVSEVPRTRVYDAAKELHKRGFVDIQESRPRKFWPISAETTGRKFEQEFEYRTTLLTEALDDIEPVVRREEQRGVWTVNGHEAATDRVLEFFESAEEEIVYMTVEELFGDEILEGLKQAAERDISIQLAGLSSSILDEIRVEIPSVEVFESLWIWSDTPAGRIMMVDGKKTLASVIVNGHDDHPRDPPSETAIWGSGKTNSLVVVLKAIFTWRLNDSTQK